MDFLEPIIGLFLFPIIIRLLFDCGEGLKKRGNTISILFLIFLVVCIAFTLISFHFWLRHKIIYWGY
jgi:hypothetical protein